VRLLGRIESPLANSAALSCCLSPEVTSLLLQMEKARIERVSAKWNRLCRTNSHVAHAKEESLIYFCETHSLCLIPRIAGMRFNFLSVDSCFAARW